MVFNSCMPQTSAYNTRYPATVLQRNPLTGAYSVPLSYIFSLSKKLLRTSFLLWELPVP